MVLYAVAAFIAYLFLSGLIWGAGYSPTSKRQLDAAASLLELKEGDTVYDLGSGFGRAVIFFAKQYRVSVIGVEIDPLRKLVTVWSARRNGVAGSIRVVRGNLLDMDLREASKVFMFLTPLIMRRVEEMVSKQMPDGGRVVSVEHRFPHLSPERSVENVHLYVIRRGGPS